MKIQVISGKKSHEVRLPDYPDPEGDRMSEAVTRRYGLNDYEKYLDKIVKDLYTRQISPGKYTKRDWPVGYKPKTRNAKAPAGKRWGHWEGGHAP